MAQRIWVRAQEIVKGMEPWFRNINERTRKHGGRTVNEQCFDSGVMVAAEMIRRLTDDQELALAVHEVCIWRQRDHENGTSRRYSADTPEGDNAAER